jgi:hypothetical protein
MDAMHAHPEGKQHVGALFGHLDSKANAGFKPGATKVAVQGSVMKSIHEEYLDELEKYISPFTLFGPSKKVTKPAASPVKAGPLTGSAKIAAVSKQPIQSMNSVAKKPAAPEGRPLPKLSGLDRIKAEASKPIESMSSKVKKDEPKKMPFGDGILPGSSVGGITIKKDEDEEVEKKEDLNKAFTPSFKGHSAALGIGTSTNAKGVTTERSFDPLKQQTTQKKFISMPFGKTVNNSYAGGENESSMAMSCDEKISLNKGGQWNLEKDGMSDAIRNLKSSTKVTNAMNIIRQPRLGGVPLPKPIAKDEDGRNGSEKLCSKCHAKKCQCAKDGVLVD